MRCAARLSVQARTIAGVAPVLHFPSATPAADQKSVNTKKALEVLRAQLGEKPAAYTRKYSATYEQIKGEIDSVLANCGSEEAPLEDGKEVTQMQVIERVLRHGLVQYAKNEGTASYADIEKWLVYTAQDQMEFNKLKRDAELQEKLKAFRGSSQTTIPKFDWATEYSNAIDRETVAEKRKRYDQIAGTTFERDEDAIDAELKSYKEPVQAEALDRLVDQLKMFKPFLAKQVVQAKLIERNAEGQLSYSRFADFNPDARDLAELEVWTDLVIPSETNPLPLDETTKRYADVRMKTKEEVVSTMEGVQQAASSGSAGASSGAVGADDARRAKLLADIQRLQTRASSDSDDTESGDKAMTEEEKEAAAEAARVERQKEMERYHVSDSVVQSKGLLGLNFVGKEAASA
eukprot:TRINITY_DN7506_c0_g1_i1.p2 TRINITY_DN7506_c0_g1~~TRINITY_DN7506_c0_g1_i1.p2  ORF type:complete len:422 (+),score=176.47 TRINITY_DN7506_c0_g1_i1:53-1267(+)